MRKMTLLDMVQNILSALDSDEVNSVSDTVESVQVAEIVRETFYEQFNNIFVAEFMKLVRLSDVNDLTKPNYLQIPSNVSKIEWIKYKDFRSGTYRELPYVAPEVFLERALAYKEASSTVQVSVDPSGIEYFIRTDGPPSCYTMFDDQYIAFDSYDFDYEAMVQTSNTIAYGLRVEDFPLEDDYIPPLDANLFPLLLAEAKSTAFINLKQILSSKEEQRARRQRIRMQNDRFKARQAQYDYWERGPNFSRRR